MAPVCGSTSPSCHMATVPLALRQSFIGSCERCPPTPQGLQQMKLSLENVTRAAIFLKESHSSPQDRSQSVVVSTCKEVAEGFKSLVDNFQGSKKTKDQKTQKQIVEEVRQKLSDLKREVRMHVAYYSFPPDEWNTVAAWFTCVQNTKHLGM